MCMRKPSQKPGNAWETGLFMAILVKNALNLICSKVTLEGCLCRGFLGIGFFFFLHSEQRGVYENS